MKGGVYKMARIAVERTTREAGLSWQPTEEQEQAAVFYWIMIMRNQYPELDMMFHIPNGGIRSKPEAVRFKKIGVKAGVPDLFLPVARGGWHGLFIEMKRQKGGRLSEEQAEWLKALEAEHYCAVVCAGAEEACDTIMQYLVEEEQ